jgi:hypothetical protein
VDELGGCRREEKWKRCENGGRDAQLALTGKKEQFAVAQGQARRSLPDAIESRREGTIHGTFGLNTRPRCEFRLKIGRISTYTISIYSSFSILQYLYKGPTVRTPVSLWLTLRRCTGLPPSEPCPTLQTLFASSFCSCFGLSSCPVQRT